MSSIALYTAVYPGAARFLPAWYASVQAQADRDFDLWISLDGLSEAAVVAQLGDRPAATFVVAEPGFTPAQVRQQALTRIADQYRAVVLVDSDDLLHPDRVAAARAWLEGADVAACGLRLVDEAGQPLGVTLATPGEGEGEYGLPRTNAFGLSNTAYGSEVLRACPPIPAAAVLVDWYLITMAWLQGARLAFDATPRMDYRQHGANMARIRSPFTAERVRSDTALVREHFRLVLDGLPARGAAGPCDAGPRGRRRCRSLRPARRRGPGRTRYRTCKELNAAPPAPPLVGVRRPPAPAIPVEHPEGANVRPVNLGPVAVGGDNPPYIVAEIGSNHNGDMDLCLRLIDAAAEAGADAVKFQSWSESVADRQGGVRAEPQLLGQEEALRVAPRDGARLPAHARAARRRPRPLPGAWHRLLLQRVLPGGGGPARRSWTSRSSRSPRWTSPTCRCWRMLPGRGKPVVISTGMATLGEIERAVDTVRAEGNEEVVLLHCVSIYPAAPSTIHLRNLETLRDAFDVPVGFSDHTLGTAIPLAAIALGACMIEKHFTLDKEMEGWDHAISSDPAELRAIVEDGRAIHEALGSTRRMVSEAEIVKRRQFRRSLVTRAALPAGHILTEADLDAKRPGTGIGPEEVRYVVGRPLTADLVEDQVLRWEHLR